MCTLPTCKYEKPNSDYVFIQINYNSENCCVISYIFLDYLCIL